MASKLISFVLLRVKNGESASLIVNTLECVLNLLVALAEREVVRLVFIHAGLEFSLLPSTSS
jgi:hypothetical protein